MLFSKQFFILSLALASASAFTSTLNTAPTFGTKPVTTSSSLSVQNGNDQQDGVEEPAQPNLSRRSLFQKSAATSAIALSTILGTLSSSPLPSNARLDPVNNPSLLPSTPNEVVIQTEKFLTSGQVKRMSELISSLERDTGFRLRVLCQNYPNTPGLAIRDYWDLGKEDQKDDKYIVLVVDQFGGRGNVLNFNVGDGVKFALPNVFWTRLSSKYGTTFFVRENGIDISITNAVEAIVQCLRSEEAYCVNVPDQGVSMRTLGL